MEVVPVVFQEMKVSLFINFIFFDSILKLPLYDVLNFEARAFH